MTTTKHTDCTHPATKAARAICRTAAASHRTYDEQVRLTIQDNATASRRAIIAAKPAAEPVDYSAMTYAFETDTCARCFGSGYLPEYAGVYGGVCFACNKSGNNPSKGRVLTRAGKAAKKAHDEWVDAHLMILPTELKPGMKFRPNQVDGWKTVVSVAEPKANGTQTIDGVKIPMIHVTITTQHCTYGLLVDSPVRRAPNADERNALIAHIANRKGTILSPR